MNHFFSINDVTDLSQLIQSSLRFKEDPYHSQVGKNKTLGLIFFNPSLRTRLSTVRAAKNLGMEVLVMNVDSDSWKLETLDGVVMDGDKAEHIKDAAAVLGEYCDVLGIRAFPSFQNREEDYRESVLKAFMTYAGRPIVNLESATLHPLQSLADLVTIEETRQSARPKVVLTWAPHVKALPQSVPNSFAQWANAMDYQFTVTCPEEFALKDEFIGEAVVTHDQHEALKDADFVYVKNWSSYEDYGRVGDHPDWLVDQSKMRLTNNAHFMHCLPVRRNVVVTDEVIDSSAAIHLQQAGNRIWSAQSVLHEILTS